jgi:xylulokinase
MPFFLGADIGTTNVKAVLTDEREQILGHASRPLRIECPRPGWSEQDPHSWWRAFLAVGTELRNERPGPWRRIAAIGLIATDPCAPPSCGTTPALRPNAMRSRAPCPLSARPPVFPRWRVSPRPSFYG